MLTIEEYKQQPKDWKPKLFNIRGNKAANKEVIKKFAEKHHLNEGQAFDYIIHVFTHTQQHTDNESYVSNQESVNTSNVSNEIAELKNEYRLLLLDYKLITKRWNELREGFFTEDYFKLKKAVEEWIAAFFGNEQKLEISEKDMLTLLVDYAQRDPSKEFPFEPVAREIFEKNTTKEHVG